MLNAICTRHLIYIFMTGVLLTILSCSNQNENPKTESKSEPAAAASAPDSEPTPMAPKPADIQPVEVPGQLVISSSAETGAQLYTSWPLIISAHVWRKIPVPDDQGNLSTVEPITIKAKTGSWQEALVLEVRNASNDIVAWPFHPMIQPDQSLVLGGDDSAKAQWWLDPSETQSLPEGTYAISVSFKPDAAEGLPGYIAQDRFYLKIEPEPAPLEPALESAKQYQMADFFLFKDDAGAASDIVDKLLAAEPENIDALSLKSKLLAGEGKNLEAANVLGDALNIYYRKYPNADPPLGLLHQRSEVLKTLMSEMVEKKKTSSPE